MKENYEEMKSKVEKVMQDSMDSIQNEIKVFQEQLTKIENAKSNDPNVLLLKVMATWFQNICTRILTLYYLQKTSMLSFVWTREQFESLNERMNKLNPEETKDIKSKVDEMRNQFDSTFGALTSRLEKINQEEKELKKKMKDNQFYG